ncbi:MAG TPA: hypothetical protein VE604_10085, partial [Candidatus Polarisedimenticolia bacterium]|nr:hypothetical protein [Candidatus Polarisedimenticolia bacterium]
IDKHSVDVEYQNLRLQLYLLPGFACHFGIPRQRARGKRAKSLDRSKRQDSTRAKSEKFQMAQHEWTQAQG